MLALPASGSSLLTSRQLSSNPSSSSLLSSSPGVSGHGQSSRSHLRIVLIASSDASLRERLRQSLTGLRWQVLEAGGGAAASWEASQVSQLEALVIDPWLPDLEVNEFLKDFHREYPNVDLMMTDGAAAEDSARSPYHQELLYALRRSQEVDTAAWNTASMFGESSRPMQVDSLPPLVTPRMPLPSTASRTQPASQSLDQRSNRVERNAAGKESLAGSATGTEPANDNTETNESNQISGLFRPELAGPQLPIRNLSAANGAPLALYPPAVVASTDALAGETGLDREPQHAGQSKPIGNRPGNSGPSPDDLVDSRPMHFVVAHKASTDLGAETAVEIPIGFESRLAELSNTSRSLNERDLAERDLNERGLNDRDSDRGLSDRHPGLRQLDHPLLHRSTSAVERIPELIGTSPVMLEVSRRIRLVAARTTPVLIEGPTGSGKEVVAEALHRLSKRSRKPLVAINCAAIPEALLEAELFGHTRGAFTGAVQGRIGRIESADGGTLFLDEIGEMPLALQSKLLRFFESGELQRIGDNETIRVDVRIVAATHQPLAENAQKGSFRADLYYRLAVFLIHTPALAEHMNDLPQFVAHFMERMGRNAPVKRIDASAMFRLASHGWPGNVRELEHVLERAAILAGDEAVITSAEIDFGLSLMN